MNITENAKLIISKVLEENNFDSVRIFTQNSCCGRSLAFDLVNSADEDQAAEMIGGLSVFLDEETKSWTGNITIDGDGERLNLIDPDAEEHSGCGGCSGGCH